MAGLSTQIRMKATGGWFWQVTRTRRVIEL